MKDILASLKKADLPKLIKILSVVAVVFAAIDALGYFVRYSYYYEEIQFTVGVSSLISGALAFAPSFLFSFYVLKLYRNRKASVIIPAIFALIAIWSARSYLGDRPRIWYAIDDVIDIVIDHGIDIGIWFVINMLGRLIILVVAVAAIVTVLRGAKNKKVLMALVAAMAVLYVLYFVSVIKLYSPMDEILYLPEFLKNISLYAALFLFVYKYKIRPIKSIFEKQERFPEESMTPELALRFLKSRLDSGDISQGEYDLRRQNVIRRL